MPVDLKKIPEEEPLPVAPDKFRWLLAIVFCVIAGAVSVLTLWPRHLSTHSTWFWFCTLILPLFAGLMVYIIRLRRYENERDRVIWWNHLRQQQYEEQIVRGQQGIGVLGIGYVTPVASRKLAAALLQGGSELQTYYSPAHQVVLTTAMFSPPIATNSMAEYRQRLETQLTAVLHQLQTELGQFSDRLSVRLHHDNVLSNEQIVAVWNAIFTAPERVYDIQVDGDNHGVMWIDDWLDKEDETLLLSVEINVFQQARDQQAESVSALLLASPGWLARHKVKPPALIHRPVAVGTADEAVADAARWGRLDPATPWFFWQAQVSGDALAATLQSMDKVGYLAAMNGELILDDAFGKPAASVGNISLICACEHAIATGLAQWLLIGDTTTQMAVVRSA